MRVETMRLALQAALEEDEAVAACQAQVRYFSSPGKLQSSSPPSGALLPLRDSMNRTRSTPVLFLVAGLFLVQRASERCTTSLPTSLQQGVQSGRAPPPHQELQARRCTLGTKHRLVLPILLLVLNPPLHQPSPTAIDVATPERKSNPLPRLYSKPVHGAVLLPLPLLSQTTTSLPLSFRLQRRKLSYIQKQRSRLTLSKKS